MKNFYYAFEFFNFGQEDCRFSILRPNLFNMNVFYRLGFLYEQSIKKPKHRKLIKELYREFTFCESDLPNYCEVTLQNNYSHRLLKRTMNNIGYAIPVRPNTSFHAWRYR